MRLRGVVDWAGLIDAEAHAVLRRRGAPELGWSGASVRRAVGSWPGQRALKDMGIPVLFMTANASTLPDGLADALGVIPKPVAAHVLKGAVRWVADRDSNPPDLLILNH